MSEIVIRQNYKLLPNKRTAHLHDACNISGIIWNHCIALQRRYYKLTGRYISRFDLQKHIAKLRMKRAKYAYWKLVGAQSVQDLCKRVDTAYKRFFKGLAGMPKFRKVKQYRSFTLFQNGWKLLEQGERYARIKILGKAYKFHFHRPLAGDISSVSVIRRGGRFWLSFVVKVLSPVKAGEQTQGKTAAFDFGLRTFITADNGEGRQSPEFFKHNRRLLAQRQVNLSRKVNGSNNHKRALRQLAQAQFRIAQQRANFHWQLAHELCHKYDTLIFEDLDLEGMKRLWGRKVSDLGFGSFLKKLQWVAEKQGKKLVFIDRFYPSSKACSRCGNVKAEMPLRERIYKCEECGLELDRDQNAARNIKRVGLTCCQRERKTDNSAIPLTANCVAI